MPTITIRVSAEERAALEAAASRVDQTLSEYVREALDLRERGPTYSELLANHERRLSALERLVEN